MNIDKSTYVTPTAVTVEICEQSIICTSTPSSQNEGYEGGSTDGWFGN